MCSLQLIARGIPTQKTNAEKQLCYNLFSLTPRCKVKWEQREEETVVERFETGKRDLALDSNSCQLQGLLRHTVTLAVVEGHRKGEKTSIAAHSAVAEGSGRRSHTSPEGTARGTYFWKKKGRRGEKSGQLCSDASNNTWEGRVGDYRIIRTQQTKINWGSQEAARGKASITHRTTIYSENLVSWTIVGNQCPPHENIQPQTSATLLHD